MTMMAIVIFTVFMIMMVTERVRVTGEPSLGQRFRGFVRATLNARIHFDARLRQRRQCAGTYTSADQGIHAPCPEKVGKAPWPAPSASTIMALSMTPFSAR